ncbi:hypothetical protein IGI04_042261 [Brassica rapa subsp. trilocularis]|uniref:Uncharacterized protein n=1 Tax=Brassica rapa subsp. trilocularis TaxID=1813537 RepID=A0ABQ7KLL5_BRACM|nr:hypothetical protein IGI04_042261 [Brassica rapa subsp. trilocularis]
MPESSNLRKDIFTKSLARLSEGNRHVSNSAADKLEYGNQTTDKPSSIDTRRPSMHTARSLRSDRASVPLGRYVATELEPSSRRSVRLARSRSLRSDRAIVPLGRYVATERSSRSVAILGRYVATELSQARSLRSDRAIVPLGRYVATELEPKLGRYVATERSSFSVATDRAIVPLGRYVASELSQARSLRSDRALVPLGRYEVTGLEPKFGRCVAIEPFRTSIRHQFLHSRQNLRMLSPEDRSKLSPYELAQAVRSLVQLYQLNYVRLDPRKGVFLVSLFKRKSTVRISVPTLIFASNGFSYTYTARALKSHMVSEPGSSEPELKLPQTHCSLLSSNPNH